LNLGLWLGLIRKRLASDLTRHGEVIFEIITRYDYVFRGRDRYRCKKAKED